MEMLLAAITGTAVLGVLVCAMQRLRTTEPMLVAKPTYCARCGNWYLNGEPVAHPKRSRFGAVPPTDEEVMRAFLKGAPFVLTGPEYWNALGLGTSAMFAAQLVYNTKQSGEFWLSGRRFLLRREAFPSNPPPEWFVVDLFQHAEQAAADRTELTHALGFALRQVRFNADRLRAMAKEYGSLDTQRRIAAALMIGAKNG